MFFDPREAGMKPPPFRHTVYNALVVPRPIGWISTLGADGIVNLAPFSFFNSLSADPPCVMFCPNSVKPGTQEPKDTLTNVRATGEFVFNMCTYDLREAMVRTAVHEPAGVDEMAAAGLAPAPSVNVRPPRVAASPVAMECKVLQVIELPRGRSGSQSNVVIGEVVGIHIADAVITDGVLDARKLRPLARMGYLDYARIDADSIFTLAPPGGDHRFRQGSGSGSAG
ncbi:MAG: flavin reductase family protein [Alphaproteobacteria bacterium]